MHHQTESDTEPKRGPKRGPKLQDETVKHSDYFLENNFYVISPRELDFQKH